MNEIVYAKFNIGAIKAIKKALSSEDVNPLFIYGPSGSGKTFLVQNMREEFKGDSELIKAEEFKPSFLEKYLNNDLLIIEDLQLMKTSPDISEALFDVIEHFINNRKQITFTADCHPREIDLPTRVISRIETGVIVAIKEFDDTSKRRVLTTIGKGLSEKVLKNLQKLDIKTMSQAIGAVKKVRVLGYVPEKEEGEEYEEKKAEEKEIKKKDSDFDRFIQDVKKGFPEMLVETKKEEAIRDEYRAKMFVWKMKGFDIGRIKKVIDGPLDLLTGEFVSYTTDIQRLIELQKRYGMLAMENLIKNSILSEEEKEEIEKALFNPDKVDWLTKVIDKLEKEEEKMAKKTREKLEIKGEEPDEGTIPDEKAEKLRNTLAFNLRDESFRLIEDF